MTPYFFAVFLIEVRSLVEVAAVNCLYVRSDRGRRERERGGQCLAIIQVELSNQ